MDIRPIRTPADHAAALAEIEALWGAEQGSAESYKLEVLAFLVSAYEETHFPIDPASPVDVLRYAISDAEREAA